MGAAEGCPCAQERQRRAETSAFEIAGPPGGGRASLRRRSHLRRRTLTFATAEQLRNSTSLKCGLLRRFSEDPTLSAKTRRQSFRADELPAAAALQAPDKPLRSSVQVHFADQEDGPEEPSANRRFSIEQQYAFGQMHASDQEENPSVGKRFSIENLYAFDAVDEARPSIDAPAGVVIDHSEKLRAEPLTESPVVVDDSHPEPKGEEAPALVDTDTPEKPTAEDTSSLLTEGAAGLRGNHSEQPKAEDTGSLLTEGAAGLSGNHSEQPKAEETLQVDNDHSEKPKAEECQRVDNDYSEELNAEGPAGVDKDHSENLKVDSDHSEKPKAEEAPSNSEELKAQETRGLRKGFARSQTQMEQQRWDAEYIRSVALELRAKHDADGDGEIEWSSGEAKGFLQEFFRLHDLPNPKLPDAVFANIFRQVKADSQRDGSSDGLDTEELTTFAERVHDFIYNNLRGEVRQQLSAAARS